MARGKVKSIGLKIYGIGGMIISADAPHSALLAAQKDPMRYEPSQSRRRISLLMDSTLPAIQTKTPHIKNLYREGAAAPSLF